VRLVDCESQIERHSIEPARLVCQTLDRHQEAKLMATLTPLQRNTDRRRHRELTAAKFDHLNALDLRERIRWFSEERCDGLPCGPKVRDTVRDRC
jgi:hypothetical protein